MRGCRASRRRRQIFVSTGNPNGLSRPRSGTVEIEAGDDFVTSSSTAITGLTFKGLIPTGAQLSSIADVAVEIYRVFPSDSDVGRTSGPPTFSTAQVPALRDDRRMGWSRAEATNLPDEPGVALARGFGIA